MPLYNSAIASIVPNTLTENPKPRTSKVWGNRFDGSIAVGTLADDGVHNGINFTQPITGTDSQGYDFGASLVTPLKCANGRADIVYILTGNSFLPALANVYNYAQPIIQQTNGPNNTLVKSFKTTIIDRVTATAYSGGSPQMHLQFRRGLQETVQPVAMGKFFIEFDFRLAPNVVAQLNNGVSGGNWLSVFEIKKGMQWYRALGKYHYGYGSYRVSIQVLYLGGQLIFRTQGDYNANNQTASFTGSISGNTLTVSAISAGTILPGMQINIGGSISGQAVTGGTAIGNVQSGDILGGIGTYILDTPYSSGSTAMVANNPDANGAGTTYWYYDYSTVPLYTWIHCQVYIEEPTSRSDLTSGITWVSLKPDGGSSVVICNQVGQSGGKFQTGLLPDVNARFFMPLAYSGGLSPYGIEACNIDWYDVNPYL